MDTPTDVIDEASVRSQFRVTGDPSWRVLRLWRGEWVVAYYCSTEDGARRQMERCVENTLRWANMSPDERLQAVIR